MAKPLKFPPKCNIQKQLILSRLWFLTSVSQPRWYLFSKLFLSAVCIITWVADSNAFIVQTRGFQPPFEAHSNDSQLCSGTYRNVSLQSSSPSIKNPEIITFTLFAETMMLLYYKSVHIVMVTDVATTPPVACRLLMLQSDLHCASGNYPAAGPPLMLCLALCRKHNFSYLVAMATMSMAFVQVGVDVRCRFVTLSLRTVLTLLGTLKSMCFKIGKLMLDTKIHLNSPQEMMPITQVHTM